MFFKMNWQNKNFPTNPKKDKKSKYTRLPDINNETQNMVPHTEL